METPVQTADRLLTALEDLAEQESMYLRGGYYDVAAETRQRAEPLVRLLASLAGQPGLDGVQARVDAVIERNDRHAAFLRDKLLELGAQITHTNQARSRAAKVAPAYAPSPGPVTPRFQAEG